MDLAAMVHRMEKEVGQRVVRAGDLDFAAAMDAGRRGEALVGEGMAEDEQPLVHRELRLGQRLDGSGSGGGGGGGIQLLDLPIKNNE